ncbi:MAG: hypothetical protein HKO65_15510, partial [Gemmatimonadetes bacterium]|nr:hypothetical protein [Gemmatimonadota bacterium]
MRRSHATLSSLLIALALTGCSEASDSLVPDSPEDSSPTSPVLLQDISDGLSDGNPHFFFLNPFLKKRLKKNDLGVFDPTLQPAVVICPLSYW